VINEDEAWSKAIERLESATVEFFKEGRPHWWQKKKIQKHNEMKAIQIYKVINDVFGE
jgi:hypothetical protein